jgi:tetratricopeptide (TPR) repeat protein
MEKKQRKILQEIIRRLLVTVILLVPKMGLALPSQENNAVTAESLLVEGKKLIDCYEYSRAIEKYKQALETSSKLDIPATVAAAMNYMGEAYYELYRYGSAFAYYDSALVAARRARQRNLEAAILNNIGLCYFADGEYESSLIYCDSALTIPLL